MGKHRVINWVNFIHFIKLESQRSIEKLSNSANYNIVYNKHLKKNLSYEQNLNKEKKKQIMNEDSIKM